MKRILILLVLLSAVFNIACPKPFKKLVKYKDLWGQTFEIKNKGTTPLGAALWKQDGAIITNEDLEAIDNGLTRVFAKSACHISPLDGKPYWQAMQPSDYIVAVLMSTDTDSNGDPAIRIPPGQYRGSEYDKGGYILIAGQVIAIGKPYGNIIAVPDHQTNFNRLSTAVEYEVEHIILAWNNPDEYERTKTHGAGTGHPIISDCNSSVIVPGTNYAVGTYETPHGKSLIFLTK
jgi:hypothetical protein